MIELRDYQLDAVERMHNGCILCGGVGSGKSRTALAYYFDKVCKGKFPLTTEDSFEEMKEPRDLYIITTAKKRDSEEWEKECMPFGLFKESEFSFGKVNVVVDSWNNIKKYAKIFGAFFIFDEQRVVGYGAWTKSFLKIANCNQWILLSATPGDVWMDYMPVFIANGFYRNKTDFCNRHVRWAMKSKYPKIEGYYDQGILMRHRKETLITMEDQRHTQRHYICVPVEYDKELYKTVWKDWWDPYDECPIKESGKMCFLLRKVANTNPDRLSKLSDLLSNHKRTIIFYNFDYELELVRRLLESLDIPYSEWNGKNHQEILSGDRWAYLVQYNAGAEGWNCVSTDTLIFYSQNYSYRLTEQAAGRIDRMNTEYKDLYYYQLRSHAPIDIAIKRALANKRNFNEKSFLLSK